MSISLTQEQLDAVEVINDNNLVLFTGPPGAGKTTTLSHWLKSVDDLQNTWCFAPTGRAAQRMMEAFDECGVRMHAKTIHAGLIPDRSGYDGNGWTFYYNKNNKIPCDRVVVDEFSMMDDAMCRSLFEAIEPGTHVVLIGDPCQLPPVGKGKPFINMIESGAIPHAKLTTVHRFAGRIAQVCQQINAGRTITPSPRLDLDKNASEIGPENFRHVECRTAIDSLITLDKVLAKVAERGFSLKNDVQVIVTRNDKGGVNRQLVNDRLQSLINPKGFSVRDCPFRKGDRVMCLQNGLRDTWAINGSYPESTGCNRYVANGESGVVVYVDIKSILVDFGDGHLIKFTSGQWRGQICLAYAITTHKSQGGGFPVAIYMIDDTMLVDRALTYTAVSRAKRMCFSIGSLSLMQRQVQKVSVDSRKTFLKEMLG